MRVSLTKLLTVILVSLVIAIGMNGLAPVRAPDDMTGTVTVSEAAPSFDQAPYTYDLFAGTGTKMLTWYADISADSTGIYAKINDPNGISDVEVVDIWLFHNDTHASDWNSATPNGLTLLSWTYYPGNDTAIENYSFDHQGAFGVDPAYWDLAADGSFTYEFVDHWILRAGLWKIAMNATDLGGLTTGTYGSDDTTMSQFLELSTTGHTSISWGTVYAGYENFTTTTNPYVSVKSNTDWALRLKATTNFTAGGQPEVNVDLHDVLYWDLDGVNGGESLTVRSSYNGLPSKSNQLPSDLADGMQVSIYLLFCPGYEFNLDVQYEINLQYAVVPA